MYWTEVVEQLFSDAMLGFAEKAECWPISLKNLGTITWQPSAKLRVDASVPLWIGLCATKKSPTKF
jgi:hypothetical protein